MRVEQITKILIYNLFVPLDLTKTRFQEYENGFFV